MRRIDLAGDWSVRKAGSKKSVPAQVPGCVHADLMAVQEIGDPDGGARFEMIVPAGAYQIIIGPKVPDPYQDR